MPTRISYVNGIVVLPDLRILVIRRIPSNQVHFIDEFRATLQVVVINNEDEKVCLINEMGRLFNVNAKILLNPNLVNIVKFGNVKKNGTYEIAIYIVNFIKTITLNVDKNYEIRPMFIETTINELLHSVLVAYGDSNKTFPKYTLIAERVLQEINECGGICECLKAPL